jgi:hypothetical protein
MGEIVNLHQVKKRAKRAEAAATAQQNRVKFGRTGAEQARDRQAAIRRASRLDASRLDDQPAKAANEADSIS